MLNDPKQLEEKPDPYPGRMRQIPVGHREWKNPEQLIMSMPPQLERSEPDKPQWRPNQIRDD